MPSVISLNVGQPREASWAGIGRTSIDKHQLAGRVRIGVLGPEGDQVSDTRFHGGPDQAVYAYAREDLDWWEAELGRPIRNGQFGENLTTTGIDVNTALVGERWQIGSTLLEVAAVRIPCNDFKNWQRLGGYDDRAWVRRFTQAGRPGPYLRVMEPGRIGAGDTLEVVHRPDHAITVATMFRALTTERNRLPDLLQIDDLAERVRVKVEAYLSDHPVVAQ